MKNRIKSDMITAMKNKDAVARDILRVLSGEIQRNEQTSKGKVELTDIEIIKIVKKLIENSQDQGEIEVLQKYLPKQLTSDELESEAATYIVTEGIDSMRGMGKIMGHFKTNFDGQYDGSELSKIIKQLLN